MKNLILILLLFFTVTNVNAQTSLEKFSFGGDVKTTYKGLPSLTEINGILYEIEYNKLKNGEIAARHARPVGWLTDYTTIAMASVDKVITRYSEKYNITNEDVTMHKHENSTERYAVVERDGYTLIYTIYDGDYGVYFKISHINDKLYKKYLKQEKKND